MEINYSLLIQYFTGKKTRLSYKDARKAYEDMRVHFNGEKPGKLLSERRPSETDDIYQYRLQIYEPITKEPCSSIITCLSKIKRSSDWGAIYKGTPPADIAENETLEQYCEYNFPRHTSVTNWLFSILLKNILIDANSVALVVPLQREVASNEYLEPYPIIFNSNQVYEYIENELAVLLSVEQTEKKGNIFVVVTPDVIQWWHQVGKEAKYTMVEEYAHGLSKMPVIAMPGVFLKAYSTDICKETRIAAILPRLNEAAREYSDMQAEIVQNIFSEKWEYSTQKCEECNGLGTMIPMSATGKDSSGVGKKAVTCTKCNGQGTMSSGPYKKIVLRAAMTNMGEQPTPTPPAGYIEKQIDIAELQDRRIDNHIYKALSCINMQFLAAVPLSQSGIAKEVDRDELNNFIYSVSEDIVQFEDDLYWFVNEYRYKDIIQSPKVREEMLPTLPVPEKFDILSSDYLINQIKGSRDAGANEITTMAFEIDYAGKSFSAQPGVRNTLELTFKLDPIPIVSVDEKLALKQAGGVTDEDFIISSRIVSFVRRAMDENPKFFDEKFADQRNKMSEYAKEVSDANSLKAKTLSALQPPDPAGKPAGAPPIGS